ncbi:MAG: PKD domain-containing protein [Gemmatimonadota bacterium]|nr:MAG: PKD domain-containing protein [Gemmatimonadota bacterium]
MKKTLTRSLSIGLIGILLVTGCRDELGDLTGPPSGVALSETSEVSFFELTGTTPEELAALEALRLQEAVAAAVSASSVPAGAIVLDFEDLTDWGDGYHTMAVHNPYLGFTFSAGAQGTFGIYHWNSVSYGNPHSGQVFLFNAGGRDSEQITVEQPVTFAGAWVGKPPSQYIYADEFWFEGYNGTTKVGESGHLTLTSTMQWLSADFEDTVDRVVFRRTCNVGDTCWWVMDDIAFTPPAGPPPTRTPWEMHYGEGIVQWGFESPQHGDPLEYDYATIPSPGDPGWGPAPDPEVVNFQIPSTVCGVCDCLTGGDFTYFRTYVDIPADTWLTEFRIVTSGVDDGIRVSIYNSQYPEGLVVPGSYVYLGGEGTADLQDYVVRGEVNTILITHVDDCCRHSSLLTARVVLSGVVVPTPPATVPPVADAGGPYAGDEGAPVMFDGSGSADPDGSIVSFFWDFGDGETGSGATPEHSYADDGVYMVTLTVTDDDGQSNSATAAATISNVAPTVGTIAAPLTLVSVGTPITVSAGFTDPGTLDTHTAEWVWDWPAGIGEAGTVTQGAGSGSVTDSHTYNEAGLYKIRLAVTDDDGDSGFSPVFAYVVVYDPTAGFVTGGGWIDSPPGAYAPDPSLAGRANFGFVAKYKKGMYVPTGQAEFQFHLARLNLHSINYEWLVVTGTGGDYALLKGSATINGVSDYKFMIWAGDKDTDTFRIRIWEEDDAAGVETDVYDNGFNQEIGGGSIVIHAK